MDIAAFVEETLQGLAGIPQIADSMVTTEGSIADGYGFVNDALYLRFYFNERTGTTAFALIQSDERVWGIDYDNRRGWHIHPVGASDRHEPCAPKSVGEIMNLIVKALEAILSSYSA